MNHQNIYNQIIERAKTRQIQGYKEKHHTIPKCLGGDNNKENIVELTAKEHFLCHILLCEIYPKENKLKHALFLMSINKNKRYKYQKYKISARIYDRIKKEWNIICKGKKKPEGFGLRLISKERNKKIGLANSKPKPKGFGDNLSKKMKGVSKPKGFGETVIKNKSKCILQYDLQDNFIKEWFNAVEASKMLNINKSQINAVARGATSFKTAGKYIWKYK